MIILAILAAMNGQPDAKGKPAITDPPAKSAPGTPSASQKKCRDVLGRMVSCNPY